MTSKYVVLPFQDITYLFISTFENKGVGRIVLYRIIREYFDSLVYYYSKIKEVLDYQFYLGDLFKDMLLQSGVVLKEYEIPVYREQFNVYFNQILSHWRQYYLIEDGFVNPDDGELYYSHYRLYEIKYTDLICIKIDIREVSL